jgi:hypothetical protein
MLVPEQVVAGRDAVVSGQTLVKGEPLTEAQIAAIGNLNPLISRGIVSLVPDAGGRKLGTPGPANLSGKTLAQFLVRNNDEPVPMDYDTSLNDRTLTLSVIGGVPPYSVAWGDGDTSVGESPLIHEYIDYSTWYITVLDTSGYALGFYFTATEPTE